MEDFTVELSANLSPETIIKKIKCLSESTALQFLSSPNPTVREAVQEMLFSNEVHIGCSIENHIRTTNRYDTFTRRFEDLGRTMQVTYISGLKFIETFFRLCSLHDIKPLVLLIGWNSCLNEFKELLTNHSVYISKIEKVCMEVDFDHALTNAELRFITTTLPGIHQLTIENINECSKELINGGLMKFRNLDSLNIKDGYCTNLSAIPLPSTLTKLAFYDTSIINVDDNEPKSEDYKNSARIYSKNIDLINLPSELKYLSIFCRASNVKLSSLPDSLEIVDLSFGKFSKSFLDDFELGKLWPSNLKEISVTDGLFQGSIYVDDECIDEEIFQNFNEDYVDDRNNKFLEGSHLNYELVQLLKQDLPETVQEVSIRPNEVQTTVFLA